MKRGILLCACWATLVVLVLPTSGRSDAPPVKLPDCDDCDCAEAEAWVLVDNSGKETKIGSPQVLKTWEKMELGSMVTDARTKTTSSQSISVYASPCLKSNPEDKGLHKLLIYDETAWSSLCKRKGTPANYAWTPVKYDADSTNYKESSLVKRYTCGKQD